MTYKEWMEQVDEIIKNRLMGVSVYDLSDFLSFDTWEAGCTPAEGADECMANDDLCQMFDF